MHAVNSDRFPAVMSAASSGCILADNGAGAQLPDTALERMQRYLAYDNAQKGRIFTRPCGTSDLITEAKTELATLLGTTLERVGIGQNATSVALAVSRLLATVVQRGDRIVVTASDHEANIAPWVWLRRFGAQIDVVPVDAHGDLNEAKYRAFLDRAPVIVALPWASNVTGTVFDVGRYARLAKAARATVVVDGVQAFPHFALDIDPAIDFAFFSAYKMYAPHLGFWYASAAALDRFVHCDDALVPGGDARYWTIESGTQSYEGLAGWLGTVAYLRGIDAEPRRALEMIADYEERLSAYARAKFAERMPHVRLYGRPPERNRLPLFAFNVAGMSSLELAERFQRAKIEARVGDFNSPRLMRSLAPEAGGVAVRLSFAHYNHTEEIDRCFDVIDAALDDPSETFDESDVPERATR